MGYFVAFLCIFLIKAVEAALSICTLLCRMALPGIAEREQESMAYRSGPNGFALLFLRPFTLLHS